MAARLSVSTFRGGVDDALAAVDVYKEKRDVVINSIQERTFEVQKLFDSEKFRNGLSMFNKVASSLASAKSLLNSMKNPSALLRMTVANKVLGGVIKDFSPSLQNSFAGKLVSSMPQITSLAISMGNTATQLSKVKNISDLANAGRMLGSLSGQMSSFTLLDKGADIASRAASINIASDLGVKNVFTEGIKTASGVLQNIGREGEILRGVCQQVKSSIVKTSDIGSLASMASSLGQGAAKLMDSKLLDNFSSAFKKPEQCKASDYGDLYGQVDSTYSQVDPKWDKQKRGDTEIFSMATLKKASKDLQDVVNFGVRMKSSPSVADKLRVLSSAFPTKTPREQMTTTFPKTVRRAGENSEQPTLDARVSSKKSYDHQYTLDDPPITHNWWEYGSTNPTSKTTRADGTVILSPVDMAEASAWWRRSKGVFDKPKNTELAVPSEDTKKKDTTVAEDGTAWTELQPVKPKAEPVEDYQGW